MSSKQEYLKRYLSASVGDERKDQKKRKKKRRKGAISIRDDTDDWEKNEERRKRLEQIRVAEDLARARSQGVKAGREAKERIIAMRKQDGSGWRTLPAPSSINSSKQESQPAAPQATAERQSRSHSPDVSPTRRGRTDSPDLSPPRRGRADSPDLSPPRRGRVDSPDLSPPRRGRVDSPDLSPPRRRRADSPDLSPPRRGRADSPDLSPPRRRRADSPDLSPPRRDRADSPDLSPPRKPRAGSPDASHASGSSSAVGARVGHATGLQSGQEFGARVRRETLEREERLRTSQAYVAEAATIVRDAEGRVVDAAESARKQQEQQEKEQHIDWASGLVQRQKAQARVEELQQQKQKGLSRFKEDADLNLEQASASRWGDPMLRLLHEEEEEELKKSEEKAERKRRRRERKLEKKKKRMKKHLKKMGLEDPDAAAELLAEDEAEALALKKADAIVRRRRPMYGGAGWPNRFHIWPGYRWDGVERGNGWEAKRFRIQAEKQAMEVTKYHYSVEDM